MAGRARWFALLAMRFGCSVPDVRAMTQREVAAMTALHDERDLQRAQEALRAQAVARAQGRAR